MKKTTFTLKPWLRWILFCAICAISTQANSQWSLTGNTGTVPGTNFIGTTDSKALYLKTTNTTRLMITGG